MENDDWDLFSIVRSCKAITYTAPATFCETATPTLPITTNTITNNTISPHNTTPNCFDDFTLTLENSTIQIFPLKPNDFIELDKLIICSNPTKIIPISTTSDIPTPSVTTTTIPTSSSTTTIITTPSTTTIPNRITTDTITNTSSQGISYQNSMFFNFPTLVEQQQMQPSEFTELEKWILQFNPTTTIPISAITTPNPTTSITSTPISFTAPIATINTTTTTTPIIPTTTTTTTMNNSETNGINQYSTVSNFPMVVEQQQVQANQNRVSVFNSISCIKTTTTNFHNELNHPLVPQEPHRNHNQLPILLPQTSSTTLLNTNPKQQKIKSGKR